MIARAVVVLALLAAAALPSQADAWNRGRARPFATLPAGATGPEGIEVDGQGNVYVTTFGFDANGAAAGPGKLYVFTKAGRLDREVTVQGSTANLLGVAFHPGGTLLVVDFGAARVLAVDPRTGASRVAVTVPGGGSGLNDLTFDSAGNVYVSDSFRGIVWKATLDPAGAPAVATAWAASPLLTTSGIPPFGANGLRFDRDETVLYVANTGDDAVIQIPVSRPPAGGDLVAGTAAPFTYGVNGADGLLVDDGGNVWVVANQSDEIVVVDPTGKAIAKLGDFGGLLDGAPVELLFPASARFAGSDLLVTNLSLDLRLFGANTVDAAWAGQVSRYTVVAIPIGPRAR
jgi:sugar lactone lactonase YvrE